MSLHIASYCMSDYTLIHSMQILAENELEDTVFCVASNASGW